MIATNRNFITLYQAKTLVKNFVILHRAQTLASAFFESKRVFALRNPQLFTNNSLVTLIDGIGNRGYVMGLPLNGNDAFPYVDEERNRMSGEGFRVGTLVYNPINDVSGFAFNVRAGRGR